MTSHATFDPFQSHHFPLQQLQPERGSQQFDRNQANFTQQIQHHKDEPLLQNLMRVDDSEEVEQLQLLQQLQQQLEQPESTTNSLGVITSGMHRPVQSLSAPNSHLQQLQQENEKLRQALSMSAQCQQQLASENERIQLQLSEILKKYENLQNQMMRISQEKEVLEREVHQSRISSSNFSQPLIFDCSKLAKGAEIGGKQKEQQKSRIFL